MRKAVVSSGAPAAIGPYSQGIEAGELVFVSGQIPAKPDGLLVEGGIAEQTTRCLDNIEAILKACGLGLDAVVKTTVFMTDLSQFAGMNEQYAKRFSSPAPARATVEVSALPKGVGIEIEAIASRR